MKKQTIQSIISTIAHDIVRDDLVDGGYFIVRETDGSLSWHYASTNWPPVDPVTLDPKDCIYIPIPQISQDLAESIEDDSERYEQELYWAVFSGYSSWVEHIDALRSGAHKTNASYSTEKRKAAARKAWERRRSKIK